MAAAAGTAGWVRQPAVAGMFYPADPVALRAAVGQHVAGASLVDPTRDPKALIAPHAGYRYSGAAAGAAYRAVAGRRGRVDRVVLVGPAHRVPVEGVGVGVTTARSWRTPLGDVPVDVDACHELVAAGRAVPADAAHEPEHSLEVHLPFLIEVLGPVAIVPLVVGHCSAGAVADALACTWGDDATLIVVSSDLSHYLPEGAARRRDARTRLAIIEGRGDDIGPREACGHVAISGLLLAARVHHLAPRTLAIATSADASGDTRRVVGYGSFGFAPPSPLSEAEGRTLLARARAALAHELATGEPDPLTDADVPDRLRLPSATFVTLEREGELAGCIGTLSPARPLWRDVCLNARGAAFTDPRFPPMVPADLDRTVVKVSVLSGLTPLPADRDAVIAALRPGIDGVVLEAGGHRGTFLPAVWNKLPGADRFLDHLVGKAGFDRPAWPEDVRVWRYTTVDFADAR
ncbi:MAG TPA: AmmeMemoRadiSam system protein B [Acidimicrobiales bacterium]|nr:AmmeMemoRadiSam system protein B [Acidimicrobiales bacterium]